MLIQMCIDSELRWNKIQGICLHFKIKYYLCIKVGTRLCETLQNGAEIRWSNSGRLRLLRFFNAKI